MERTVGTAMNAVSFGPHSFSDLDFADDVALLAELIDLLVPALETMASKASSLGLEVNWQKTKVQALGSREDEPLTVTAQGQECMVLSAGQLPRRTYTRLMLSVNGVCESCWESNGTIMCRMTM